MKKIISLLLCVVMLATCIAGCGKGTAPAAEASAAPAAEAAASSGGAADSDASDLPFVELTWYCVGNQQSNPEPVFEKINEYLKEKLNCSLNLVTYDYGSYDEMMSVMSTAGEEFDICFISSWTFLFDDAARKGFLMPLDDLIEKYGQDYKAQVPEMYRKDAIVDGQTYGIVDYQIECNAYALEAQKEYLDKYNFDITKVKEMKDFEPLFEAVKADDPSMYGYLPGNAQPPMWTSLERGMQEQCIIELQHPAWIKMDGSNEIINIYEQDFFVDNLRLLHDWYEKGYIPKDAASRTDLNAEQRSGKYLTWVAGNAKPGNETEAEQLMGFPVKDIIMQPSLASREQTTAALTGISSTSKNPERAMMLINLLFADKYLYNLLCFGIEGTNYEFAEDGTVTSLEEGGYNPCVDWAYGNQFNAYVRTGADLDVWEQTEAMNDAAIGSVLGSFSYDKSKLKTENAMVDAVVQEYQMGLLTGTYDPDEKIPEFLQALDDAGYQAVVADMREQLDAYFASQK